MQSSEDLRRILIRIDGRGYKAYREIQGAFDVMKQGLSLRSIVIP